LDWNPTHPRLDPFFTSMALLALVQLLALVLLLPHGSSLQLQLQLLSAPHMELHEGALQRIVSYSPELFQRLHVTVEPELPRAAGNGSFLTVSYYKTGCAVSWELHVALFLYEFEYFRHNCHKVNYIDLPGEGRFSAGRWWDIPLQYLDVPMLPNYHVEGPAETWDLPPNSRTVHWVRDPVKQIISAYRYNSHGSLASEMPELYLNTTAKCGWCDMPSHHAIFELCGFNCTYSELINALPEEAGVMVEATHESAILQHMVANIERWANEPGVLFLSMDHLSKDFDATMECLLSFSGLGDATAMDRLQFLDVSRYPSDHTTSGQFNNTALEQLLEQHPAIAGPVPALRAALSTIYERQHRIYGCPVP